MSAVGAVVSRERVIVGGGLVVLVALCWLYLWRGAGMGMPALMMTETALFPHRLEEPMPGMVMPEIGWVSVVAMWWVMMIAMMLPSAAPMVLLYLRVIRHGGTSPVAAGAAALQFVAGYLLVWLLFSLLATAVQLLLRQAALISPMMLWSQSATLSAAVLAAAGIYQLTPLKRVCLNHCRGAVHMLTRHWQRGRFGPLLMGMRHGAWCVGCCWMLMAILFVGGVMNLLWIALLTILVLIEKLAPHVAIVGRAVGVVLLLWGVATLVV